MKHVHFFIMASLLASSSAFAVVTVTSIGFKSTDTESIIEIKGSGPITFEKQENSQDKQLVIELKDVKLAKSASRKMDTSSFNSNVSLISPYQVKGASNVARIVVQLREDAITQVDPSGNTIKISIPLPGGGKAPATAANATSNAPESPKADLSKTDAPPASPVSEAKTDNSASVALASAGEDKAANETKKDDPSKTTIEAFLDSKETKRFTGKPITLNLKDADLLDVFQLIGEASGFNVVIGDDVKGKITITLADTPWDQALDLILRTRQLGAERNNNILRISTLSGLTSEKQAEIAAKKASEAASVRITRIFPISYAKLADLQSIFQKFASSSMGAETGGTTLVQADERTNSIVVRDTPENMERIKALIQILDTQTPQVMIEAKVIEATESSHSTFGGALGIGRSVSNFGTLNSFNGGEPTAALTSVGNSTGGGSFGITTLNILPGVQRLNALLSINEGDSKIKVIASPKTVVLNKETANIVSGTPIVLTATSQTPTGPVTTQENKQANLSLSVKPTVTNDGGVLMDVTIQRDNIIPAENGGGQSGIASRSMTTKVLIESGTTLVIGGVYTYQDNFASSGFPFLRKIPILGALFGTENQLNQRVELMIFITPRILNEKESGLIAPTNG